MTRPNGDKLTCVVGTDLAATVAKLEARRAREQPYARADGFGVAHLDGFAEGPRQPRVALLIR